MTTDQPKRKAEIVDYFLAKKVLVSDDFINSLPQNFDPEDFYNTIAAKTSMPLMLVDQDTVNLYYEGGQANNQEAEESRPDADNQVASRGASANKPSLRTQTVDEGNVKVTFSYKDDPKKRDVQDFVSYYNARYKSIKAILENRQELQNMTSINRLHGKKDKEPAAVIGMVLDKATTPNDNIVMTLEDPTGTMKVIVNKNKPEIFGIGKEVVLDEVIGVVGVCGENVVFANNILLPEIPLHKELKKSPDECYAVFISDVHVGSKLFLPDEFGKFIKWLRGEVGNETQKDVARKVRYIFIMGDLVDGIGVYPAQESELDIVDIGEQYAEFARLISQIPEEKRLIICPGNHDAQRLAEPQPEFDKDFAKALCEMPNVTLVTNPAYINIHATKDFPGFDVLMYHGYSFDHFIAEVDSIRAQGGYERADLVMRFLLQRRHLSPTHTATPYIPDPKKDPLVVDRIPDFFATGHVHKAVASMYRNITLISGSCWQSKTSFQEKMGHNPEPARVPLVNLQTRQVKMLRF